MKFPKELTTATPLSKYLAMLVFVSLPIVGFFFGMRYQEMVDLTKRQEIEENLSIPRTPTPTPIAIPTVDPSITANWITYNYTIKGLNLTFRYPPTWEKFPQGEGGGVSFHAPDYNEHDGIISIAPLPPQASLQMICGNEIKNARQWSWINLKETQTKLNGIPTTILKGKIDFIDDKIHDRVYVVLMDDKHCIRVDAMSYNNPSQEETFDQILATFQFLP